MEVFMHAKPLNKRALVEAGRIQDLDIGGRGNSRARIFLPPHANCYIQLSTI
jgi:uncharacterized lipoprotein YbaY